MNIFQRKEETVFSMQLVTCVHVYIFTDEKEPAEVELKKRVAAAAEKK